MTESLLKALEAFIGEHDADVTIATVSIEGRTREWSVQISFGSEAADSPLYARSVLGNDASLERAIEQALREAR